ncbi:MAG TPA: gliding motility lipoprotein GldD [Bacteroidales bacterium]|nr:gliding motility lipoprotein GldD [Bacteroidales bacterium]
MISHKRNLFIYIVLLLLVVQAGCKENFTPKPRSYYRIDFPEKKYISYHAENCNYSFEVPVYARVTPFSGRTAEPCWINIEFPGYKGQIHITYKPLENDLNTYVEDIRTLAYKHSIKADDIIEKPFSFPDRNVNGIIYDIKGNTASSMSFFATDSNRNFLSGALYFNVIPNKDSLAPVIQFFSADVLHLIETLHWN